MTDENSHRKLRDEALYNAFKKVLRDCPGISEREAIHRTLRTKQPRLWLSFYGAYRVILGIENGKGKTPKHKARDGVVDIVRKKYYRLKNKSVFAKASCLFITSFILAEPSEGFFVSESYAKRIIWKMRKQKQSLWRKQRTT